MKNSKRTLAQRTKGIASRAVAFLALFALLVGTFSFGVSAQRRTDAQKARLNDEQRILHVLNRLGFGARPGDVERVRAMGLESYINQQLSPEKISDAVSEAKVKDLAVLKMTTAELYEKYPQPGQLLRQLERRGELPAGLATARDGRARAGSPAPATHTTVDTKVAQGNAAADQPGVSNPIPDGNPQDNQKYRQALRSYYQENGLQLPQRITAELQASRILRAVYSERQLQEVMVDFWTNHFNVFAGKGADRWLLISYDRDTIRPNAMGKFSELLSATAQSPAMLFYLDNFQSVSPDAKAGGQGMPRRVGRRAQRAAGTPELPANLQGRRRGINENYARELMELHTLGVDGGYTQKDVQEVARCFTGWTILAPRGGAAVAQGMGNGQRAERLRESAGKFFFNPRVHDDGEKTVLGQKIPAGGGFKDGLMVLDILAHHPATAKFVATKLARYFVSDSPPPALVTRVAGVFTKSNGDIRETLRSIFSSPEFNSPEAYRAKVKRPFELAISAIRTLGAETTGGPQLHQWIARMGEPLYGFQTPNGYSDLAESWVNTGGLLERLNFGLSLASNRIPGTRVDLQRFLEPDAGAKALNNTQITDRFLSLIVAGDISPKTKEALMRQLNEKTALVVPTVTQTPRANDGMQEELVMEAQPPFRERQRRQQLGRADANITDPVTKIVGLILGSPEFQRQ
ncbi:MAG: DUF1800 domain-containing protein [Pyrinomonadaceae bacterium]|nr:DUF1800 domain-containing protein [Pyrinomonadaceae bacterium]